MWARGRLDDLALTTFAVDPARLAPLLAPGVEPATVATAEGLEVALVSAVSFVAHDLRVPGLPLARFSGGHVDYRAAVRFAGERAVWFLGAAMSSPLAWLLGGLWSMPWHRASVAVDRRADSYRLAVTGHRWTAGLEADVAASVPAGALDGFEHVDHAAEVLVNARLGLFRGRGGRLRAYRAVHEPPTPRLARAVTARVALFEELGLVDSGAHPHSVLVVDGFDIAIELPPRHAVMPG